MNYSKVECWERFQKYYTEFPSLGLAVDLSRMNVDDAFFARTESKIQKAFADMARLEKGGIANPDENRMVGHYWLRVPALAPTPEIRKEIEDAISKTKGFSAIIHAGEIHDAGSTFKNYLLICIGHYNYLVNVNVYPHHSFEVDRNECGNVIIIQPKTIDFLDKNSSRAFSVGEITNGIKSVNNIELVFKICNHLSSNSGWNIKSTSADSVFALKYSLN